MILKQAGLEESTVESGILAGLLLTMEGRVCKCISKHLKVLNFVICVCVLRKALSKTQLFCPGHFHNGVRPGGRQFGLQG